MLRGSLPSPASQVDNPLKFGSPPPSSTPELIPVATEASLSSLIPAANGIIPKTPVDSDLILSSTDVILGFSDHASMNHVVGNTATTSIATLVCGDKSMEVVGGVNTSRKIDRKGVIDGFNPDKSKEFQELLYDSAFNIVGYNPFVNLECGPTNSAWLENIQRSAVLPQVAQLKLPRNKWESLYEQMVLEMIELLDIETAHSILRNTQVTCVLKQEQPERYLQLQHLHAGTYFDLNEAYPDSTKEQRHAQTARALAAEVIVVPPSRLMILIC
ncbi:hypothetical protein RchiOBHm_Chr6g0269341 [Rosa chinensis]|uniref:Uncharacterized protein n=1 Tax=Rosa chinensis TaxID=74649 RepID=A0A2P6PQG0_ROSCH|nr:hypothetical protein RchiOBHm_Chr6g0269341 [Rosa chinensis]